MTTRHEYMMRANDALGRGDYEEYIRNIDAAKAASDTPLRASEEPQRASLTAKEVIATLAGLFGFLLVLTGLAGALVSSLNGWNTGAVGFIVVLMVGLFAFVISSMALNATRRK